MKIAMLGTRGVPAQYGGFETAVEEIGPRLVKAGHDVFVYCRNPGQVQREYLGMQLINLPAIRKKSLETLSHTALSVTHTAWRGRPDVAFLFNAANAPFLPILRAARIPTALHLDGLEWQRAKWNALGKRYYRAAERWSVRLADEVIADARGIGEHVLRTYNRRAVFIPYGAPIIDAGSMRLNQWGLSSRQYHLVVARFAPENNLDAILEGFAHSSLTLPLVVVGSASYRDPYDERIRRLAAVDSRIQLIGPVWDQSSLDELYAHAAVYWHGHSVGGTNPSLLRALGAAAPVNAFDVSFNREVAGHFARYFRDAEDVARLIEDEVGMQLETRTRGKQGQRRVAELYQWDSVAMDYLVLAESLATRRSP